MLKKLLPATGVAAEFEDHNLSTGIVRLKDRAWLCVFNWSDQPATLPVKLPAAGRVSDLWSGRDYGRQQGTVSVDLKAREGTVLVVR